VLFFLGTFSAREAESHPVHPLTLTFHTAPKGTNTFLLSLLSKQNSKQFLSLTQASFAHLPGTSTAISGSAQAFLKQTAAITSNGVNAGESLGVVSFAQFNDRFFFLPSGAVDTQEIDTVGNNPLNTGSAGTFVTINNPGLNQFTFAKTGFPIISSSSLLAFKLLPNSGRLLALNLLPRSGAVRALLSEYSLLTRNAVSAGRNLVSNPLGGQFTGTWYGPAGGNTFFSGGNFLMAFGNNPLNNPSINNINVTNPLSYLNLANGKRLYISSGELLSTYYVPLGGKWFSQGYNVYALGSNPANMGLASPNITVIPSQFINYLLR